MMEGMVYKMNEKRFTVRRDEKGAILIPNSILKDGEIIDEKETVDLLNEQQSTIQSLKSDKAIAEDYANIFEKENVKLRKQIGEQQATIRKLQDLCGESDGENAKLRLKNKELQEEIKLLKPTNAEQYEQIVQLQKENEYLKKQLKRFKDWINSDKYDYELTLAFIKNKGYSLKDVLEYEKELEE